MVKPESLKLNPQQLITDEPIISILDEANEISTLEITLPQEKLGFVDSLGLLSLVKSEEKKCEIYTTKKKRNPYKSNNLYCLLF